MIIRKSRVVIIVMTVLAVALTAAGIALAQTMNTIDIKNKEGVGAYLTDAKGMTLYYFKKDSPGKSACEGPCVENWPLFHVEKVTVGAGINAKDVGEIVRADGKKQTTYKGMPLYYFKNDKAAGDTNGHGVKDVWFAVKP